MRANLNDCVNCVSPNIFNAFYFNTLKILLFNIKECASTIELQEVFIFQSIIYCFFLANSFKAIYIYFFSLK